MTEEQKSITYKDSGVDIQTGNEFVKKLPSIVNSTFDKKMQNRKKQFFCTESCDFG